MIRYFVNLTFSVVLLALLIMSAQAQNLEKQADKPAAVPSEEDPFAPFQQFSAILNGGLGGDTNRKIYRSGKLMRFDFRDHYRIVDLETRSLWLLYPKECSKVAMLDPGVFPFSRKFRVESSTVAEAKETVNGHVCKIEDMVLVSQDPLHTTFKMKLWRAEDLNGFPLKINVENPMNHAKFAINYSEVDLQPPDPKLFEHPAKCANSPLSPPISPRKANPKPAAKPAAKPADQPPQQ